MKDHGVWIGCSYCFGQALLSQSVWCNSKICQSTIHTVQNVSTIYWLSFSYLLNAAVGNFGKMLTILCCIHKKCHNTHWQLLVSDVVWEYHKISVLSHRVAVFTVDKNPVAPVLFAQSALYTSVLTLTLLVKHFSYRSCNYHHHTHIHTHTRYPPVHKRKQTYMALTCQILIKTWISEVYAVLLSNIWRWNKLISCSCPWRQQSGQATLSVDSTLTWDGPVYSTASFPATVLSQF